MSHLGCNRAQWIYSIIFVDLLTTIMEPGSTALAAWTRFPDLFQDNQNAHVVTLERGILWCLHGESSKCLRILSTSKDNFWLVIGCRCSCEQSLSGPLAHFGLTDAYRSIATLIWQSNSLPSFHQSRSMLTLEEVSLVKMTPTESHAAYLTT